MATRSPKAIRTAADPLVSFYTGLARLAADEGELREASRAYQRAFVFARLASDRRGSPWVVLADHMKFGSQRS